MRLESIRIERASNGFVVHEQKRTQSKDRPWVSKTTVHKSEGSIMQQLTKLINTWAPETLEED